MTRKELHIIAVLSITMIGCLGISFYKYDLWHLDNAYDIKAKIDHRPSIQRNYEEDIKNCSTKILRNKKNNL